MPDLGANILLRLATVFVIIILLASELIAQPVSPPSIVRMGNGLTLILQEDHAAELVGIDVFVKAGSRYETAKNNGVSHFIEHLLFGATQKRQAGDMDREMESLGATLDAHTTNDCAHFSTTVSSRYLPKALDVFADAINNSAFRNEDISGERMIILDEIARKANNPFGVCRDLLAKKLYGEHPYGLPIEGAPDIIKTITRDDILDYYHRLYVPSNIAIVLVGDFDKQSAISQIGRLFQGQASATVTESARPTIPKLTQQSALSVKASFRVNCIAIGFVGPPGSEYDEVCATDVLISYLGQGYGSWLSDELKTKQAIVIDGTVDFVTEHDPGLISIIVACDKANVEKAKSAIFAKIAALKTEGINQADIDRAKRSLLGEAAFSGETVGGRAHLYGFYFSASDPMFATKYTACVQSVTNDTIMAVARKYFDFNSAAVVMLGPDQEVSK